VRLFTYKSSHSQKTMKCPVITAKIEIKERDARL
jgi:hypothetical protein